MPKASGFDGHGHDHSHPPALHSSPGTALMDAPLAIPDTAVRRKRARASQNPIPAPAFHALPHEDHHPGANHQAELFYLQKQIQQQTQMIFVIEDGARVQGVIEWYDRHSIKVRGKSRILIYKSAIKYLYKAGELGSAPGE